jgi:hypothetical protein
MPRRGRDDGPGGHADTNNEVIARIGRPTSARTELPTAEYKVGRQHDVEHAISVQRPGLLRGQPRHDEIAATALGETIATGKGQPAPLCIEKFGLQCRVIGHVRLRLSFGGAFKACAYFFAELLKHGRLCQPHCNLTLDLGLTIARCQPEKFRVSLLALERRSFRCIAVKLPPPPLFERVSATVGLRFRETGFWGAETPAPKRPRDIQPIVSRDKAPRENPPIRRYLHDTGKSLFVWDCVVGPGGLEPPTKRL